jgi:tetratricopeptide (TPR) repeat protein
MAKPYWQKVLANCPSASQNVYIHGVRMMKIWIDAEQNPVRRTELVDSLMMIYDMRIQYFNRKGTLLGQKGMDLAALASDRYEEAYTYLKTSVETEEDASDAPVLYTLMAITKTMYDNQKLTAENVIETYSTIADYLDVQMASKTDDAVLIQVKANVDEIFSSAKVANCENLTDIFEQRVKNNPENIELLKKTYNLLNANRCQEKDFYRNTAEKLFAKEPTASLAYELAKLHGGLNNYSKAETYFKRAIELEIDTLRKSIYLVEYAGIVFNNFKKPQEARSLALQSISINPNMGHAYMLIGNIYASEKNCFSDEFQKKTVYWVAVDKFIRAKQVDPTLENDCNRYIDAYSQYFPAQNDIFFQDLTLGDRYSVGGWINETTIVRARP